MKYANPSKKVRSVVSTLGHAVNFPARGTPKEECPDGAVVSADGFVFVHVPSALRPEVVAAGMLADSEIDEAVEAYKPLRPSTPDELQKQAFEAFDILVSIKDRESFSGTGTPKGAQVEKLLGYSLQNSDIKELWAKYKLEKRDGEGA